MSILISLAVGIISALLTKNSMNIYGEINTPAFAPPGFLFPIVWTVLFILMGISSAMIYLTHINDGGLKFKALTTYGISLAVNFLWSIIFFNLRMFLFSFLWIVLLWITILLTILEYKKINKASAYLQIPYLVWVTFAAILNFSIYMLNK